MTQPLSSLVLEVAQLVRQTQTRVVFAESCTAGLVSAILARVPGISEFHCGSAVVYRLDTKTNWLGVSASLLENPGPVSDDVARAMAVGVLQRTPEASLSAAVTGHLGPNAPSEQDGLVFVGLALRTSTDFQVAAYRHKLPAEITDPQDFRAGSLREWRQWKAAELVLNSLRDELKTERQRPDHSSGGVGRGAGGN